MAQDIQHFTATIPAGTPLAAPVTVAITIPVRVVRRIDWKVPPGPSGTMGFLIAMGKIPVLPVAGTFTYIVTDAKDGSWDTDGYPDSGAWQVIGYNTGANPHSVLLTLHCDLPAKTVTTVPLIPAYELGPSYDLSKAGPPVPGRLWPC